MLWNCKQLIIDLSKPHRGQTPQFSFYPALPPAVYRLHPPSGIVGKKVGGWGEKFVIFLQAPQISDRVLKIFILLLNPPKNIKPQILYFWRKKFRQEQDFPATQNSKGGRSPGMIPLAPSPVRWLGQFWASKRWSNIRLEFFQEWKLVLKQKFCKMSQSNLLQQISCQKYTSFSSTYFYKIGICFHSLRNMSVLAVLLIANTKWQNT